MKNNHLRKWIIIAFSMVFFAGGAAQASEDTAVVESLTSERQDLQEMDFLGNGRTFDLPSQPVNATHALNLSAGVSNCNVFLGRSFN